MLVSCCCWYHKGTNFQANHNRPLPCVLRLRLLLIPQRYEFSSKSQHWWSDCYSFWCCCWYHKGTNFQANHNELCLFLLVIKLLLIPQRYEFSSKSQLVISNGKSQMCCCWYHKGTNFQANHNMRLHLYHSRMVVADTTKVRIFKQITTPSFNVKETRCCCWYHKGTNFQANHNYLQAASSANTLLLIPQRYEFSSKSQLYCHFGILRISCCWYHKGTNFQANHN